MLIPAGRVGRPHGLDGSFHVVDVVPELLSDVASVVVDGHPRVIERRAGTRERPILRLEGSSSRDDAVAVRGSELLVEEPPLEEGEFRARDVVGCRVVDGADEVGVVARMVALPSCEALEVGEELIPLVSDAIRALDLEARVIDVDMEFVRGR
jgi:16S rRNA processing protein RimM